MGAPKRTDEVEKFYEFFAAGKMVDATALFDPSCVTSMPCGPLNQAEHEAMGQGFKAAPPLPHVKRSGSVAPLPHLKRSAYRQR